MSHATIHPHPLSALSRRCSTVLLGSLLTLAVLTLAAAAAAEEEFEDADFRGPDFRFEPPRFVIGLRGGAAFNRANGEIFNFLQDNLTLDNSDFIAPAFALDLSVRTTIWLDVVFGFEAGGISVKSEFRDFVFASGAPIKQTTTLTQIPLTLSLKIYPLGRGHRVGQYAWVRPRLVPYLGGGLGGTWYRLSQNGDFVDFTDLTIFEARLRTQGWAFAQHAFVGLDLKVSTNFGVVLEGRYYWARADVGGEYVGFDPISLDGGRVMLGLSYRI
jgi:opacity protein-like surface antigen